MKVQVLPRGKKMKEKVKQYGPIWQAVVFDPAKGRTCIQTLQPVHKGGYPYTCWVSDNDCLIERFQKERS